MNSESLTNCSVANGIEAIKEIPSKYNISQIKSLTTYQKVQRLKLEFCFL